MPIGLPSQPAPADPAPMAIIVPRDPPPVAGVPAFDAEAAAFVTNAGDEHPEKSAPHTEPDRSVDRFSLSMGGTLVGKYISRGVAFALPVSYQPTITLTVNLPELAGGAVTSVTAFAGTWNSVQAARPGLGQPASGPFPGWYESDLYAGVGLKLHERFSASFTYYRYTSPAGSYPGYNDLSLNVSYDDKGRWGPSTGVIREFRFAPAMRIVEEVARPGRKDALYVEPALTPTVTIGSEATPFTLAVPLVIGLSNNYYDAKAGGKETFGFFRTGVHLSVSPFRGVAQPVTLHAGFDWWFLNDRVANGLHDTELIGRVGLSLSV